MGIPIKIHEVFWLLSSHAFGLLCLFAGRSECTTSKGTTWEVKGYAIVSQCMGLKNFSHP